MRAEKASRGEQPRSRIPIGFSVIYGCERVLRGDGHDTLISRRKSRNQARDPMIMRFLVSFTKGVMLAVGITLPRPEQEKAVAIIWVVAFVAMIAIILGVGWAVLSSLSRSMN